MTDTVYIIGVAEGKEWSSDVSGAGITPGDPGRALEALINLSSVLARVIPASFFAFSCCVFWKSFVQTGKWTSLVWMFSEGMVVLLLVIRRESHRISRSPWDWFVAFGGSFSVLLVRPTHAAVAPEGVGVALLLVGALFEVYAKAYLGRSFGIVAAHRGVVFAGPYRIVRHPIYLGYFVTHVGFLLTNWSSRNVVIYIVLYLFQVARILSEERILKGDKSYNAYCDRVRYRLIPFIF
jgi:protein-S-isoprenylcysteine O-methyltransferase Ste14